MQPEFTFYWHDYETFGADPSWDRPAQFAGIRTDAALNEVDKPLVIYCKPPHDRLPQPEACLLTGITPQIAEAEGVIEPQFIARIHEQLAQPGTCALGYNTLRFDDEVTRYALYRNFYDPYAREWQHGNSRWDLIDLVRMAYALRPDGINWPCHESGKPSFRLEDLARANGLLHESAHDALSDVRATIALAKLIKARQPRLYEWLFRLRDKREAARLIDMAAHTPLVHTSRMYPAETGCTTLVMPMLAETANVNSILVYDLRHDPSEFLAMDTATLAERLFTPGADLPPEATRLPVKAIKLNKCPALAPRKILDKSTASRIKLDIDQCLQHAQLLSGQQDFMQRILHAYTSRSFNCARDAERALYDGFISNADRALLPGVRLAPPEKMADYANRFQDKRYSVLLFRYRARFWPQTLSDEEKLRWQIFCQRQLIEKETDDSHTLSSYQVQLDWLRNELSQNPSSSEKTLDDLEVWGATLARACKLDREPDIRLLENSDRSEDEAG
ncbi:MAG: exodeoxyribonuclease I [Nitrosomonas sp.]|nr:exodeoxyribonuclease I [Nitrosomonas sp.]